MSEDLTWDANTIGARLRVLRKWRKLTLVELGGLSGLSPSFLSMAERGQRLLDRRSHIAALSSALAVSETDLVGGPHLSSDRQQSDPHMTIPALRVAIQANELGYSGLERARPLEELVAEMAGDVETLRRASDYVGLGGRLPALIDELFHHAAHPVDEAAHVLTMRTLVEATATAAGVAKNLGYADLANQAAMQAMRTAEVLNDPVQRGKAAFSWLLNMPREGTWDRTLIAAEREVDRLEPHAAGDLGVQVLGQLTLTAALSAAAAKKNDRAGEWIDQAAELAGRVPDDPEGNWQAFSATNVGIWRITVGVERGLTGGTMLELAKGVRPAKLEHHPSRLACYLSDIGKGLAREPRTRQQAVRWLREAEDITPQRIRNSPSVRETVKFLLGREIAQAGGRELRGMAARMGVPH